MSNSVHSKWMKMALNEAMKAYDKKEIPNMRLDLKIFNLIRKRTKIVKYMLSLKGFKKQIIDHKRIKEILKKIKIPPEALWLCFPIMLVHSFEANTNFICKNSKIYAGRSNIMLFGRHNNCNIRLFKM